MHRKEDKIIIDGSNNRPIIIDITFKEKNKSKGIVLFSHGFKGFKDWGPFNQIAKTFAENDFIFIKFNFSHNGTTIDNPTNFTDLDAFGNNNFCKELDDLGFVIDWIEQNHLTKESILNDISLFGHSRGGGISILKAAEDNRIKKVISWASPSNFTNLMSEERVVTWKEKNIVFVYNGRTKQNMPMYYQFYESGLQNKERIDISKAVQILKIPQLIVHGSEDPTVFKKEAQRIKKWNHNAQLHIVNGANHVFGACHPYQMNDYPTHLQEAMHVTLDFLKK